MAWTNLVALLLYVGCYQVRRWADGGDVCACACVIGVCVCVRERDVCVCTSSAACSMLAPGAERAAVPRAVGLMLLPLPRSVSARSCPLGPSPGSSAERSFR